MLCNRNSGFFQNSNTCFTVLKEFVLEFKTSLECVCDEISAWFRASVPQDVRTVNLPCLSLFGLDESLTRPVMELEDILSTILEFEDKCKQDGDSIQRNRAANFFKAKDRLLKTLTSHEVATLFIVASYKRGLSYCFSCLQGFTYICCAQKSKWSKLKN